MPKLSKKAIFIKEYEAVLASWVVKAYVHCIGFLQAGQDIINASYHGVAFV